MSLIFYTGSAGSGKTHRLVTDLLRMAEAEKLRRFFLIVPEQFTMETQRRVVLLQKENCILNLEVTSLNRLAYRVFAELGYTSARLLEEIGKSFLLEKAALEQRKNLVFFRDKAAKPDYVAEMKAIISEMMLYDVSPETLAGFCGAAGSGAAEGGKTGQLPLHLRARLRDISLLYASFRDKLEGTWMTAEEVPSVLGKLAEGSALVRDSVMAFDGFTGFTPVQLSLIQKFLPLVRDLMVTVTLGEGRSLLERPKAADLFALSYETVRKLKEAAYEARVPEGEHIEVQAGERSRHALSPSLNHLERNLFRRKMKIYESQYASGTGSPRTEDSDVPYGAARSGRTDPGRDLRIFRLPSPRDEVLMAARAIVRLVRDEGLRYRDIAVVTGDPETYGTYSKEIFGRLKIPYFIDEKRNLISNPFIEFVRAAVQVCAEDYSYEGMMRLLKSPFSGFEKDGIDKLENYLLGRGIRGKKRWENDFLYCYKGENPAELPALNVLRKKICDLLGPLSSVFSKRGGTVLEKSTALYEFCAASGAERKLKEMTERFGQEGRGELSLEYAQVYPYFCAFLDKLVAVLKNERISMKDYAALLDAGFAEGRIAVIPPGSDRVLFGDMERSRIPDVKVLFFLGVREGLVPKPESRSGILTEADRENLENAGIRLKPSGREKVGIERFYLYTVLTKPKEKLIVSYSTADRGGQETRPSYIISILKRMFPGISEETPDVLPGDLVETPELGLDYCARMLQELCHFTGGEADEKRKNQALQIFSFFLHDPRYGGYVHRILGTAFGKKGADQIGKAAAKALYGDVLYNSATRLERFFECEFRHFLDYGLRLRERPSYEFSGLDFGNIIHRSLELYARRVTEENVPPGTEKHLMIAEQCLKEAAAETGGESVLFSSARSAYELSRMDRMLKTSVEALVCREAAGEFRLYGAEKAFRSLEDLDALNLELPGGGRMALKGRIDRIDICESGDVAYVRVVDYKTGQTEFDAAKIYYGLQLQLSLYMNASLELLKKDGYTPRPAGMFYQMIQDPILPLEEHENESSLFERHMKKMKGSGVVLDEPHVIALLDRDLRGGKESLYIPVRLKNDGSPYASSRTLSAEDFHVLGEYARRKALEAGAKILSGKAGINPYKMGSETACMYCPFSAVCGFRAEGGGSSYRLLPALKRDEAVSKMQEELK